MRWIQRVVAPVLLLSLLASGCAASKKDVHDALDRIDGALDTTDAALQVTSATYAEHCRRVPTCKACSGKAAEKINAALALGPLTIAGVKAILADLAAE